MKPGFWYHIAGWTYEEPTGEVLDPIKLLNSYGFGLCYHIAPLLEAVFEAGGFADARCWFLTGHTVAEVFYNGRYHYFDSDMMGYNVAGDGSFRGKQVVSVRDLERNANIILGKLASPGKVKPQAVDYPWYPADVRAHAMKDLADLFTTTGNNYLYSYTRYSSDHSMDFVLRPGEKLIRYFKPEEPDLFYLPFKFDGKQWTEFPQEIAEYHIRTSDGPRSQKDDRLWATGKIEYTPPHVADQAVTVIDMPSPYVIIDARFTVNAKLPSKDATLRVETSTDGGRNWTLAGTLQGPHQGEWTAEPAVLVRSAHGKLTAVSGSYGYKLRLTKTSTVHIAALHLVSRIQLNPRTLPTVQPGENHFVYSAAAPVRRVAIPVPLSVLATHGFELINQSGQELLRPPNGHTGEIVYSLDAGGAVLTGFDVGARFLDLRNGLAPDKLTAETRRTNIIAAAGPASLAWSVAPDGPFQPLWSYPQKPTWLDGDPISRLLLWPQVFQEVRLLPAGTKRVYVKIRSSGPAVDDLRFAVYAQGTPPTGQVKVTQIWSENGQRREHVERFHATTANREFTIRAGKDVQNLAIVFQEEHL